MIFATLFLGDQLHGNDHRRGPGLDRGADRPFTDRPAHRRRRVFYIVIQVATVLVLALAANTAFADFPRLSSFLARDSFMPRQFAFRGERLAFTTGIVALSGLAALLVVISARA